MGSSAAHRQVVHIQPTDFMTNHLSRSLKVRTDSEFSAFLKMYTDVFFFFFFNKKRLLGMIMMSRKSKNSELTRDV